MHDLDLEMNRLMSKLEKLTPGTDQYDKVLDQLMRLSTMEKEDPSSFEKFINNQALVALVGNLAIAILVVNHERLNVITSRAFSFVRPLR